METLTLNVLGMSCEHCKKAVVDELSELDGVAGVEVSLEEKKVTVTFDSAKVDVGKIKETITETGYEVVGNQHGR